MEAYCLKCREKREMSNPGGDHDEEREAGDAGEVPGLRDEDVQEIGKTAAHS